MQFMTSFVFSHPWISAIVVLALVYVWMSIRVIGPTEVGLVMKRIAFRKLSNDNPIGFQGEAGYQAELLMPGRRWKPWLFYEVEKFPWVQVPAGEIGVVIAQVGEPLPIGAKSAVYRKSFGNFSDAAHEAITPRARKDDRARSSAIMTTLTTRLLLLRATRLVK